MVQPFRYMLCFMAWHHSG